MARPSYIVAIVVIALTCVLAEELYSSRFDDVDVRAIFNNAKLRNQYYNCFMDLSPCKTADQRFFKGIFSEALQSGCKRCTEKQKENLEIVLDWYTINDPIKLQTFIAKSIEDLRKKNSES
ncbi:Ejaculatory bulb-specific protein 3-like [Camponotus japonicus]